MIGLRDNVTLAVTKLRSRRIRLIVTLIVSGLLFAVLVAGSLIVRGTFASLESFAKDGFSTRFMTMTQPVVSSASMDDPKVIKRAEDLQKELVAKKTAEAKRLGIQYDAASEMPVRNEESPEPGSAKGSVLNLNHPMVRQAMKELTPAADPVTTVRNAAKDYGLKAIYRGSRFVPEDQGNSYEFVAIHKGKEVAASQNFGGPDSDALATFGTMSQTLDNSLLEPFTLEGLSLKAAAGEPVPILAPMDAAEKLVGLEQLPRTATAADKLARLKEMREKVRNLPFEVCYRNSAAMELRQTAKQQAAEAAAKREGYVAPALMYAEGGGACSPVTVSRDTRSAEEKALEAKQTEFDAKFGKAAPQTAVVKFRIVGLL
ncbi:MAG: LolC/E family lipoprotein releasing system, transrane protein, partial [Candidatus Saccharibacteria bacterium]|nr:LolC/E family lipoprotein releasing system, transrane protein [Candidatus Saccharibacteria bacterium]